MTQPPDLALITDTAAGIFRRQFSLEETRFCSLRDITLTMMPVCCKEGDKALRKGLVAAHIAGCRLAALAPEKRGQITFSPLQVADGRLLVLSCIKRRLDIDCPGWQKDTLSLSADDNFSCLTARWLAAYCGGLHICGQDADRRKALASLVYRERGLIATESSLAPKDSLFIQAPGLAQDTNSTAGFVWQNWPETVLNAADETMSCHLAEGLLLLAGGIPPGIKPLPLLSLLRQRGIFHKILPI